MKVSRAVPLLTGHSTQRIWTWRDQLSRTTAQLQQALQTLSSCSATSSMSAQNRCVLSLSLQLQLSTGKLPSMRDAWSQMSQVRPRQACTCSQDGRDFSRHQDSHVELHEGLCDACVGVAQRPQRP